MTRPASQTPSAIRHRQIAALAARNRLASDPASLRLVEQIASRIHRRLPPCFAIEDLVQEGMIAMIGAAERYDPDAHNAIPFSAFARQRINGAILDSVSDRNGSRYTENTRVSIDAPQGRRNGGHSFAEDDEETTLVISEAARALARLATHPYAPAAIDKLRLYLLVSDAIAFLPPEQQKVLRLRYSREEPHITVVARRLGLSRAEAEAIHADAIAALQARLAGRACLRAELPRAA